MMVIRRWIEAGAILALSAVAVGVACGGGATTDARYPKRPEGCDVKIFHETPDVPTDNLGPVQARCAEEFTEEQCLRTLKDAVCGLGGDVAWGVNDAPEKADGKNRWFGRAAHTKTRAPSASSPAALK
jgi:hypothetical protein